jgi:hypothetical protein
MQMKEIRWKNGIAPRGIKADAAFEALEEIRERNGGDLTDDVIVNAASRKNHTLHPWFEWDDSEAARAHRRRQAADLLSSFRVVYEEAPDEPVRVYEVHRSGKRGDSEKRSAYRTTEEILQDPLARDQLIARAIRSAMEFRRRFRGIHELSKVVEAMDEAIELLGTQA